MSRLALLPLDVLRLVAHFVFAGGDPLLGLRRAYGIVGTGVSVRDDKAYRRDNVPPTPVVKRALMAIWRSGLASAGAADFRLVTLGTDHVVRYRCDLRGFHEGRPAPSELGHLLVRDAASEAPR